MAGVTILMCIRIIMAWSFYLPVSGQVINCAQYGLMAMGAYTAAFFTIGGWPFIVALILGGLVAAIFSLNLGFLGLRLKGLGVVIITIGYAEVIRVFLNNADKFLPAAGGPQGMNVPVKTNVLYAIMTVLIIGLLQFRLIKSKIGRAIKAVGSGEKAAESVGVNTTGIKLFLMMASGFLSGISGGLLAHYTGYIEPEMFGFPLLVEAAVFSVVGGLGTMWGSVVGVLLIDGFLESMQFLVGWRVFIYGALIVTIMLFRPSGILTEKERKSVV